MAVWNDFDVLLITMLLAVLLMALMSWFYRRTEILYQLERSTHRRTGSRYQSSDFKPFFLVHSWNLILNMFEDF
jgi:hypothetical protein